MMHDCCGVYFINSHSQGVLLAFFSFYLPIVAKILLLIRDCEGFWGGTSGNDPGKLIRKVRSEKVGRKHMFERKMMIILLISGLIQYDIVFHSRGLQ
jgi:hypothetical protein